MLIDIFLLIDFFKKIHEFSISNYFEFNRIKIFYVVIIINRTYVKLFVNMYVIVINMSTNQNFQKS